MGATDGAATNAAAAGEGLGTAHPAHPADGGRLAPSRSTAADFLQVQGLQRHFGALRALEGVSLSLPQGEAMALLGESGGGKSTLARLVAGLDRPSAGRVLIGGRDVHAVAPQQRRSLVQLTFQDAASALAPHLRAWDAVTEGQRAPRAERRARADRLLAAVGLPPGLADRLPHELSGGERQRLGLARALSAEPALLVADEPVAALDPSLQAAMARLLLDLRRCRGLTYLLVLHDPALALHLVEHTAILQRGRLCEVGPARTVLRAPRHPYTQSLVARRPRRMGAPPPPPAGCPFAPECPLAEARCQREAPALRPVGPAHSVACHLVD